MTIEQSEKSGLAALFRACHGENRAALIGYLPTGYPDVPDVDRCDEGVDRIRL